MPGLFSLAVLPHCSSAWLRHARLKSNCTQREETSLLHLRRQTTSLLRKIQRAVHESENGAAHICTSPTCASGITLDLTMSSRACWSSVYMAQQGLPELSGTWGRNPL